MRFLITMRMAVRQPKAPVDDYGDSLGSVNLVHQMNVEHESASLGEFANVLQNSPFVVVEEFYRNPGTGGYYSRGYVIINTFHIGKVKEFEARS